MITPANFQRIPWDDHPGDCECPICEWHEDECRCSFCDYERERNISPSAKMLTDQYRLQLWRSGQPLPAGDKIMFIHAGNNANPRTDWMHFSHPVRSGAVSLGTHRPGFLLLVQRFWACCGELAQNLTDRKFKKWK